MIITEDLRRVTATIDRIADAKMEAGPGIGTTIADPGIITGPMKKSATATLLSKVDFPGMRPSSLVFKYRTLKDVIHDGRMPGGIA